MKWNIEGVVINKKLFPCSTPTEVEKSATSSGADNIATFTTNERKPLTSLDITIVPSQEGSGDPSPDNVRPIVIYNKVTAKIQKGTTKVKEVVSFGKTVYGLTGDCVSGEFEETHGVVDLSTLTWTTSGSGSSARWYCSDLVSLIEKPTSSTQILDMIMEKYKPINYGVSLASYPDHISVLSDGRLIAYKYDDNSPSGLCAYPLATPTELTTDPVTITTFAGEQTVRFDEKIPFTLKYLTLEGDSCDIAKHFLPLFYNKERRSL